MCALGVLVPFTTGDSFFFTITWPFSGVFERKISVAEEAPRTHKHARVHLSIPSGRTSSSTLAWRFQDGPDPTQVHVLLDTSVPGADENMVCSFVLVNVWKGQFVVSRSRGAVVQLVAVVAVLSTE